MTDAEKAKVQLTAKGYCSIRYQQEQYQVYFVEGVAKELTFTAISSSKACEVTAIVIQPYSPSSTLLGIVCNITKRGSKAIAIGFFANGQLIGDSFDMIIF